MRHIRLSDRDILPPSCAFSTYVVMRRWREARVHNVELPLRAGGCKGSCKLAPRLRCPSTSIARTSGLDRAFWAEQFVVAADKQAQSTFRSSGVESHPGSY